MRTPHGKEHGTTGHFSRDTSSFCGGTNLHKLSPPLIMGLFCIRKIPTFDPKTPMC